MNVIEERMVYARPTLDVLDQMEPRYTVGGWSAICYSEDHGRKGWRGPLYLHEQEIHYEGGPAYVNAAADALLHDLSEHHVHFEVNEPTWDEIISGSAQRAARQRRPAEKEPVALGVPFQPTWERLMDEFIEGFLDFFVDAWDGLRGRNRL